jgi:hypothetical protein
MDQNNKQSRYLIFTLLAMVLVILHGFQSSNSDLVVRDNIIRDLTSTLDVGSRLFRD